jgi:hypothetical protein
MKIYSEISVGELIDKISILRIKSNMIKDQNKLKEINKELEILMQLTGDLKDFNKWLNEIEIINLKLWQIEDKIRLKEKDKVFDEEFIDLTRQVYYTNDERFVMKNNINKNYDSNILEQKSYERYT